MPLPKSQSSRNASNASAEHTSLVCPTCDQIVVDDENTRWIYGCTYHVDCLRCAKCNSKFANPSDMYQAHKKLLCRTKTQCNSHRVRCAACSNVLQDVEFSEHYTDNQGHFYHRGCFKCFVCNDRLAAENCVHALGRPYHRQCFRCEKCMTTLKLQAHRGLDKKLLCAKCHDKLYYPTCVVCKKCITDVVLQFESTLYYHEACFKCSRCQQKITADYYINPTTRKPNCAQCAKAISVPLEADVKRQVRCTKCQHRTPHPRLGNGGQILCRSCLAAESNSQQHCGNFSLRNQRNKTCKEKTVTKLSQESKSNNNSLRSKFENRIPSSKTARSKL